MISKYINKGSLGVLSALDSASSFFPAQFAGSQASSMHPRLSLSGQPLRQFATHTVRINAIRPTRLSQRCFSTSRPWQIATKDMSPAEVAGLKVQQDRLMADLHHTCQWGTGERWGDSETETGMARLSLSDTDKLARDWFVSTTRSLGCAITIDAMGNTFAVRPGRQSGAPTVAGSHLDTQPTGGRYDGILGVTAAVEMLRVLDANKVETEFPIGVVNWTNEEGARFPISMVASGVWSGEIAVEKAHALKEVGDGDATMRSELERIGYLGETAASHEAVPLAAHFELHIEQGPILEAEERKVGIVKGVQAYKWFTVTVRGRDCHTGTTSFAHRADAMLAASKMILYSHRAASRKGALASTGILTLKPGSTNTVPGTVRFSLDIRAPQDKTVEEVEKACKEAFKAIAAGEDVDGLNTDCTPSDRQCSIEWRTDSISPAINFHDDCIDCVKKATKDLYGGEAERLSKPMVSGAGHDSVYTSYKVPTTMIFIPCRDGVSHNPTEFSTPEDCAIGAQILTGAVVHYDRLRAERGA